MTSRTMACQLSAAQVWHGQDMHHPKNIHMFLYMHLNSSLDTLGILLYTFYVLGLCPYVLLMNLITSKKKKNSGLDST
jgi:hypothetical protein